MKKGFLLLFAAAAAGEMVSRIIERDDIHHWTKPLLMVFLGLYYYTATVPG